MKILYFNDEQKPINVFLNGLGSDHFLGRVEPAQELIIDIKMPKGHIPFIKKWSDYVMVSSIAKKLVGNEESSS